MEHNIYSKESYKFDLPEELIAKYPANPRDAAKLLVLDKNTGSHKTECFGNIVNYLDPDDVLVINETRVIPARLGGFKSSGARIELLLLKKNGTYWEALVKPARRLKKGDMILFPESQVSVQIIADLPIDGGRLISFNNCEDELNFINQYGQVPLPPYIGREAEVNDRNRYQTVFAKEFGSVAAPTAGLHFTEELIAQISAKGVRIVKLVLHVGVGTFRPVACSDIREHKMHKEYYSLDKEAAATLNNAKLRKNKIVAVGTTVVRTLETVYNDECGFEAQEGETEIFIFPGYEFRAIDCMITNFHLPESSLLMLVTAFAGFRQVIDAYSYAINNKFRFYSYGDAMFVK